MHSSIDAIVLAAGCSTRFLSSYNKLAHKIGNLELLNHTCNNVTKCTRIVVVTTPDTAKIAIRISNHEKILQREKRGTGAAVKDALTHSSLAKKHSQWVLICYADMPLIQSRSFEQAIENLIAFNQKAEKNVGLILSAEKNDDHAYGRLVLDQEQNVVSIAEADMLHDDIPTNYRISNMINAGIVIRADVLYQYISHIPVCHNGEERITDLIQILTQHGYRFGYHLMSPEEAHGVNTIEELEVCEKIFQKHARQKHRAMGCIMPEAESVFFSHDTFIEHDVTVMPHVYFGEGVVIKSGSIIQPFCMLSHCVIENSIVGPFAHIRNDTHLQTSTVGNFVEVKSSTIHRGSKIKHLSYIGNADIDENVNVGAGVITCNYDGFQKHHTSIGKDSFVGAGSIFVAPITVGANNLVAAGSIVQESVTSQDNIIISRHTQKIIPNGFRRYKNKKQEEKL